MTVPVAVAVAVARVFCVPLEAVIFSSVYPWPPGPGWTTPEPAHLKAGNNFVCLHNIPRWRVKFIFIWLSEPACALMMHAKVKLNTNMYAHMPAYAHEQAHNHTHTSVPSACVSTHCNTHYIAYMYARTTCCTHACVAHAHRPIYMSRKTHMRMLTNTFRRLRFRALRLPFGPRFTNVWVSLLASLS